MMKPSKRVIAMLLCLLFCFGSAMAEDAFALRFTAQATLHPEYYPEAQQLYLKGVADLLTGLTVSGTADAAPGNNRSFDAKLRFTLNGKEADALDLRWFGNRTHWQLESALLGDQSLMINQLAMPEFAMKTQSYLDLKLQPIVLALSPYSTREAPLDFLTEAWKSVFHAESGSRSIAKADVLRFAKFMAENANYDHHFRYAVDCLFSMADLQDQMHEWIENMVEWADALIAEDGIQVTVDGDTELWTTGTTLLYKKSGAAEAFYLPKLGGDIDISLNTAADQFQLTVSQNGQTEIGLSIASNHLPSALPWVGDASLDMTVQLGKQVQHMLWWFKGTETGFSAMQLQPETHAVMLEVNGTWEKLPSGEPSFEAEDFNGVNILSVNDTTLPEFVRSVKDPLIKGLMPSLTDVPSTAFDTAFRLLDRYQIMNLLLNNAGGESGETDEPIDADDT